MLALNRPNKPANFDNDVSHEKSELEYSFMNNLSFEFEDIWGKYKKEFFLSQYRKCAFCEKKLNEYGDIEHYRPKGEIHKLSDDENDWGSVSITNHVKGRKTERIHNNGYWWLAYDWNNYLMSCRICNSPFKGNLFPIENEMNRQVFNAQNNEIPLLINPFENVNISEHLKYDNLGAISKYNDSKIGFETIKTYGLYRESLRDSRSEKAEFVFRKLNSIEKTNDENSIYEYLEEIYTAGKINNEFAGMVRIIFEQNVGLSWLELESLFEV